MLLADYIAINDEAELSRQIKEVHGLDISEATIRYWAYYDDKTPKPKQVILKSGRVEDVRTLGESLIEKRLKKLEK